MKRLVFIMAAAAFVYGCAAAQAPQGKASASTPQALAPQEKNCGLQAPPKEASPSFDGDTFIFTYPNILPDNYTGCQTQWEENGKIGSVIHFKNGDPIEYRSYYRYTGKLFVSCRPRDSFRSPYSRCPGYEASKFGFETRPFKGEVPPERDPRGKGILPVPDYVIQDASRAADMLEGENCALQTPPKNAVPYIIFENYFDFIYPVTIHDNYIGCQIIWNKGGKSLVLHFNRRVADAIIQYEDNKFIRGCEIREMKVRNGFYCPDYGMFDWLLKKEPFNGKIPPKLDQRR